MTWHLSTFRWEYVSILSPSGTNANGGGLCITWAGSRKGIFFLLALIRILFYADIQLFPPHILIVVSGKHRMTKKQFPQSSPSSVSVLVPVVKSVLRHVMAPVSTDYWEFLHCYFSRILVIRLYKCFWWCIKTWVFLTVNTEPSLATLSLSPMVGDYV